LFTKTFCFSLHTQPPAMIHKKKRKFISNKNMRPILNFAPRGELWPQGRTLIPKGKFCPPGANFVPKGWSYPLGVKFSVRPSILLNNRECSPLEVNEGVNIPPRGQIT
jgi:hypothetical protein